MNPTILFFDSGVGGLSVYRDVRDLLPHCNYLYCCDNAFFPYSEKQEDEIIERAVTICRQINAMHPLDVIVIACNTASTVALPALRQEFQCHVVGTVPAIKPAAALSQTKRIGLLATKGTVKRTYVTELIERYATDCVVEKIGSTKLAEIAEHKLHGHPVDLVALREELSPWLTEKTLDTVILGCTHFPLIREEIQLCLPQVKYFVDSGKAIAKRIQSLLDNEADKVRAKSIMKKNQIFCTALFEDKEKFEAILHQWGFEQLKLL
ncbi:glutamate racemase [Conservatibacter flavescens]|uniref:Glutamate racemase n=1 Tax=Conservatibacter flavescens TaxID=28161 RepID=A0A2M8S0N6_9PAST|nr:glutamate racemase [Conservatibacter flavescens]PJG84709.1 glutamate racemase [Conservatibacter flavescens]